MQINHIETKNLGIVSTVKVDDFILQYNEGVQKFLRDNHLAMGDAWVESVGEKLYNFQGKNDEGDLLGSSTDMGVAIATFCPEIPLIRGKQLLEVYRQAGNRNPFGNVYVDFGVAVIGSPKTNSVQAQIILDGLKSRGIEVKEGRVLDFAQLRLVANKDYGLAYKIADDVSSDNVSLVSTYPFAYIGKNGLFRAYLYRNCHWNADFVGFAGSSDDGRVVRYDAEGVARASVKPKVEDLVSKLGRDFAKRF